MDLQCHVSLDQMSGGAGHEKVFALVDHEGVTDNLSQHPLLLNRVVAEKPLCSGEMVDQRLGGLMLRVILLQVLGLHQHERLVQAGVIRTCRDRKGSWHTSSKHSNRQCR